nr:MAG: hypothetical protein DIU68_01955 [Chloroflexota bacterium]
MLAACDVEQTTDIYLQDILDVQDSGETIYNNAVLAIEFSGDEEDKEEIGDLLKQYLNDVSDIREEERNYSTYLLVNYKLPIALADNTESAYRLPEVRGNIFTFVVIGDTLNIAFNNDRFKELDAALYKEYYRHLEFEDFTMRVFLHNDLRDPVSITLYSVYVNNMPVPYSATFTAERRDELEVIFSDVLRDSAVTPGETETSGITLRQFAEFELATK